MTSRKNPSDHESIDRQIRIEKLKEELQELAGGKAVFGGMASPEEEEAFLQRVLAFEKSPMDTDFNRLVQDGIELPSPESLPDSQVKEKLWEVIEGLAKLKVFLEDTDHLSDRELYAWLWSHALREENQGPLGGPMDGWQLSPLGGCGEEDQLIYLKYYADEMEREDWQNEYEGTLPPHEDPPFDRDQHLPR